MLLQGESPGNDQLKARFRSARCPRAAHAHVSLWSLFSRMRKHEADGKEVKLSLDLL